MTFLDEEVVVEKQKKKKKASLEEIGQSDLIANGFYSIKNRCSPSQLYRAIRKMSEKQKVAVKKMGFGNLLKLKIDGIPKKLGHFVIDSFDESIMGIRLPGKIIKINEKSIYNLIGIPNSGIDLGSIVPTKELPTFLLAWKDMYGTDYISPFEIVTRIIKDSGDDSFLFQVDFLIKSGGFGSGKLLGMSVSIVRKSKEIEDSQLKIKKVEDMLAVCGSHLAKTIGLLLLENPTDIEIKGFVSKFESLFKERPINLEENNVRRSKHEADCSKMMSGLKNTDINATMEVGRLAKTGENEEGDRLREYDGVTESITKIQMVESLNNVWNTPDEQETGNVEDGGQALKKKKVEWIFDSRYVPSYSIGLTQKDQIAVEVEDVADDLSENKQETVEVEDVDDLSENKQQIDTIVDTFTYSQLRLKML
ncbi:hypothetical protein L1987_37927 [Smallanthus sonchifolius]|uniref:Uncharacterized protein n=1 Tax=Smallanthus sonchifolius TaxID=185202 RepID=A0ACB9HIF4_9ASTR|nr:hypothetical protein L1987_37927 [Smallanthus sonchifolius]